MDYGFAFPSAIDIHKDVALAERKLHPRLALRHADAVRGRFSAPAAVRSQDQEDQAGYQRHQCALPDRTCDRQQFHDFEPARPGKGDHGHRHWQYGATNTGNAGGTTSELRQHIDNCRGLLAGQTVPYEENSRRRAIRFLNPTGGWINLNQKVILSQNLNSDILVMLPTQH
jgi:hypothetical protein